MSLNQEISLQAKGEWAELRVLAKWSGMSLRHVLEHGLGMGSRLSYRFLQEGKIQMHNKKANERMTVTTGDRIMIHLFEPEDVDLEPDPTPVEIVYEDDHVLVANKPAGITVHSNDPQDRGTLVHRVLFHYLVEGLARKPRPVHRLDQHTSGGVLFANHEWAQVKLDQALREGQVKREYVALVTGQLSQSRGTISLPIGRDRHHPTRRRVSQSGVPAVTHYKVIETYKDASLVRLMLETGKTHQIRVHMSHLGHPLLGDVLYGGSSKGVHRQALHGDRLKFIHPVSGESIELNIPWASDFATWVNNK
jgi:23S rRNA pseudouridine1911/1915/1917 synthase